jgi:ABC-2 type transport system permease protein
MRNLLAAEYLKLRTTKTTWALLAATIATTSLAVIAAIMVASSSKLNLESLQGVRTVLHVTASGGIFVLVLGVIIAAGEYRQRTATDTFLTTPKRWKVITSKLIVATSTGVIFGALAAGSAIAVANHVYTAKGYTFPLGSGQAWTILGGSVLAAALFGALGAATGSLVRNQVSAIVGWLTWLFVIENIILGFSSTVGRWLPDALNRSLVRDPDADLLPQSTAAYVLLLYGVVIMLIAVLTERRRDA